jgi:hypothetical protein
MPKFPDPDNNREDKIAFIVAHRFGTAYAAIKRFGPLLSPREKLPDTKPAEVAEKELAAMADPELEAEYQTVRAEIWKANEARAKAEAAESERREASLLINLKPDFTYWAKVPFWTIEEAVALVHGRDPKYANRKAVAPYLQVSPFARLYEQTLIMAQRAVGMEQLTDGTLPGAFIAWAKRYDIPVAAELEKLVAKYGQFIGDWKTLHDRAASERDAALERERKLVATVQATQDQIDELRRQMEATESRLSETAKPAKDPDSRELDSLRKLSVGLAIKGYGYDPGAPPRGSIIPEIVSDLAILGIPLSDDTVRKHLKAGAEMLPPDWQAGHRKKGS